MGLDTIVAYASTAGVLPALAPTSLTIKGNTGDAYIVGIMLYADDATKVTVTCPGDPRWEAGGIMKTNTSAGVAQEGDAVEWLATKVPVKCGAALVITTTTGTGEHYCLVYVEYPTLGDAFKLRDPLLGQPPAFQITKTATAGAALTAFTIATNSTSITSFQRGKVYTPIMVEGLNAASTGPAIFVGIQNTKTTLVTWWNVPLTPIKSGSSTAHYLPYGLNTVDGGETQWISFLSTTTDTPAANITYAYSA